MSLSIVLGPATESQHKVKAPGSRRGPSLFKRTADEQEHYGTEDNRQPDPHQHVKGHAWLLYGLSLEMISTSSPSS